MSSVTSEVSAVSEAEVVSADTKSKHRALYLAVIEQAILDFFGNIPTKSKEGRTAEVRDDAERFLLDVKGEWADSRRDVCNAAGIDPDWLRRTVWERLERATA